MGQCSFLLTVLAFRCPLSVYFQIDSGCGIKIVAVFISKKYTFLGTNLLTDMVFALGANVISLCGF